MRARESDRCDALETGWKQRRRRSRLKRAGLLLPMAAIGAALVLGSSDPWSRWVIAVALAVLVLVLIFCPEAVKDLPFKSIGFAGLNVAINGPTPAVGDEEQEKGVSPAADPPTEDWQERWLAMRWALERKLAYLVKHTLPDHLPLVDPGRPTEGGDRPFATIGSLEHDGLLLSADARTASIALSLSLTDLEVMNEESVRSTIEAGEELTRTLRLRVFNQLVAKQMEILGWRKKRGIRNARRKTSRFSRGPDSVEIVSLFGTPDGDLVRKWVARKRRHPGTLIVTPIWPGTSTSSSQDGSVVRFDQLAPVLAQRFPVQQEAEGGGDAGSP
ncbi:MAG TPA: hypothetical protein VEW93_01065 [Acidimicrobiales bacterium]|nr:hypothetical protein [Acidimicrobiales bacterium]